MRSWYEIKAAAGSAEVYLYDEIGFFGISASDFVRELRGLKGKALNVYINSPGGDVFDGIAIYNALKRHDKPVNITVDALAASIASVIAQAGTTRNMAKAATMMIHDAWGLAVGDPATMEKMRDELDRVSDIIADIYVDRAGGTTEEWRGRMAEETWYKAEDAVKAKLADGIAESVPEAAYAGRIFNLSKFNKVPDWVEQDPTEPEDPLSDPEPKPVQTSPEGQEDEMADITAIRQALGLDDEGDIIQAIASLKAAATDISTGEKGVENQLRRELAESRQQILSLESEYGQRILKLEDSNRKKEAEWAVDSAIQQGRVAPKDKVIAMKLALSDPDAFNDFASNLRVDLNERGMATDAQMADLEPGADEMKFAAQLGLTREAVIAQKAADKGITLPG